MYISSLKTTLFSVLLLSLTADFASAEDKGKVPPVPSQPVAAQAIPRTPPPVNPQQERMKDCNNRASEKKGEDRKAFMKACLAGEDTSALAAKKVSPQQRMKDCNVEAKTKKLSGQERKDFMKSCLKAK